MDLVKEETKRLLHPILVKKEMMRYRAKMVRFRTEMMRFRTNVISSKK